MSELFQIDESGRRPPFLTALLWGMLGVAIFLAIGTRAGFIKETPLDPNYRRKCAVEAEQAWQERWAGATASYRERLKSIRTAVLAAPWNPPDPSAGHSPLNGAVQARPPLDMEYHPHPEGRPYWLTMEVPRQLTGAAREQYIARYRAEFLTYEADVDRFLANEGKLMATLRWGTNRAPWFESDKDSLKALRIRLAAEVGQMLLDPKMQQWAHANPKTDLARIIFENHGGLRGEMRLPHIAFARTPAESARMCQVSPLQLNPLFRESKETPEGWELVKLVPTAWGPFTVQRTKDGSPLYSEIGVPLAPDAADLVCHVWLWEYLIDSRITPRDPNAPADAPDSAYTMAMNMNPLLHLMKSLVFQFHYGLKPESPEVEALFSAEQLKMAQDWSIGVEFYWTFVSLYESKRPEVLNLLR